MNKSDWSKAPEWATMFGTVGRYDLEVFASDEKYYYDSGSQSGMEFYFDREWSYKKKDFTMLEKRPTEPKKYKGQMTKYQLKCTKIRIKSKEHGKAFRDMVDSVFFDKDSSTSIFDSKTFYFCNYAGDISHQFDDFDYFDKHPYTEIEWEPEEASEDLPDAGEVVGTISIEGYSGDGNKAFVKNKHNEYFVVDIEELKAILNKEQYKKEAEWIKNEGKLIVGIDVIAEVLFLHDKYK